MAKVSLAGIIETVAKADDPSFASPSIPKPGGVDPLGLRQINFELMDKVFPGINNVCRHVRPFVVVTWAWRRAQQLAEALGTHEVNLNLLQDFVDRIDVIYTWSQFLRDPNVELPGKQVLRPLLQANHWDFSGAAWEQQRKIRRLSTALSAPINYGPALKMLGWIHTHTQYHGVMMPSAASLPAVDAFETCIADLLDHEAFSKFGSVVVTRKDAVSWADRWAIDQVSDAEAEVARELLLGVDGQLGRRAGASLILAVAAKTKSTREMDLRPMMAGAPTTFTPPAELVDVCDAWRRVQVRQVFRLALEALLHWTVVKLDGRTLGSETLVAALIAEVPAVANAANAGEWLEAIRPTSTGPTELIRRLEDLLDAENISATAEAIVAGIAFCLAEDRGHNARAERSDRLPLFRARNESAALGKSPVDLFLRHVLESWVLAQHAYWSVGRGLADARAGGKTLLRLRVILDEGGWTLTPVKRGRPPAPTPDRLQTMLSLMSECGLLDKSVRI